MLRRTILTAIAGAAVTVAASSAMAAANFEGDVNTAINKGIDYLDTGLAAFSPYPTCLGNDGARGMPLLVVLEKRASGNLDDPPQGYVGASEADKTRMRRAVACILYSAKTQGEYAYYYGNWLMALALYARTGGPDKGATDIPNDANLLSLVEAIDKLTDGLVNAQDKLGGGWSYTGGGDDSSTTQFAAAGLAGAKAFYLWKGDPGSRLAEINTALTAVRNFYVTNGSTAGSDNGSCDRIEETEKGHGYHPYYNPSLQQTASGMWVQQLGGATVNDPSVQAYLRWLRNHYRWQDLDSMGNSWPGQSHWYYMWSAIKGLLTIEESKIALDPGNVGPDSIGVLGPTDDPDTGDALAGTCNVRQQHRDPATVERNTVFGTSPLGFYADESKSEYFDFASIIIARQCATGSFLTCGSPGSWDSTATQSWALLVLQRATGGACADADNDGKCDGDDGGGPPPSYAKCDVNGDTRINVNDLRAMVGSAKKRKKLPKNAAVPPADQAANVVTAMYDPKKGGWFSSSGDTEINIADFTRCIFLSNGI